MFTVSLAHQILTTTSSHSRILHAPYCRLGYRTGPTILLYFTGCRMGHTSSTIHCSHQHIRCIIPVRQRLSYQSRRLYGDLLGMVACRCRCSGHRPNQHVSYISLLHGSRLTCLLASDTVFVSSSIASGKTAQDHALRVLLKVFPCP